VSRQSTETSELPRVAGDPLPDASGHFDRFGGRFVPEALYAALLQLEREFHAAIADPRFKAELSELLADYTGRPSPITEAKRFSKHAAPTPSGQTPIIVLKREDLNHTGSHKINNVLGQALLSRSAWCRDRHRSRAVRARLHRLHGEGRYRATGTQRRAHAPAGR
jgi:hypothetical protein